MRELTAEEKQTLGLKSEGARLSTEKPDGYVNRRVTVSFDLWVQDDKECLEGMPQWLVDFAKERMQFPEGPESYPFAKTSESYYIREARTVRYESV